VSQLPWSLQKIKDRGVSSGPVVVGDIGYEVFVCTYGDQQHFAYRDADGSIQDAWYGADGWDLQKINNEGVTSGPPAAGGLFVCVYNNQQHFSYIDHSGNIQDAWWDGNRWQLQTINNDGVRDCRAFSCGRSVRLHLQQPAALRLS
jgi:hypothetical protein